MRAASLKLPTRYASSFAARGCHVALRPAAASMSTVPLAAETHSVEVNGVQLHARVRPGGAQAVLCMPGAMGTAETDFEHQLNGGLGEDFTVVSFDPRGYGASRPPARDFPLDFYARDADDAKALMAQLGYDEFSVLGWSDGANSACILAASEPAMVRRLVVWGGNSYITPEDIELWEKTRDVEASWSPRMYQAMTDVYGAELQPMWDRFCDGMLALQKEKAGDVCLHELHKITCPTLVLHGANDAMVSAVHPKYFVKHIQDASLHVFPEGKHNVHQKYAPEFNHRVSKFLSAKGFVEDAEEHKGLDAPSAHAAQPKPDISSIAYGFMGSKALFSALHLNVFDAIHALNLNEASDEGGASCTLEALQAETAVPHERLLTLVTSLTCLGLVERDGVHYSNSAAVGAEMVSSSRWYWGDYLKYQIDLQFYERMRGITHTLQTGDSADDYDSWFDSDPEAAALYTKAQHSGSLATAFALMKRVDLASTRHFLDVGGGSGAFAIALCRKVEGARATVLDLPNVVKQTAQIVSGEPDAVSSRIGTHGSSALADWGVAARSFDVVNMSYISGSVPIEGVKDMYAQAYAALEPGGRFIVHDFMVDNSRKGPVLGSLWALAHVAVNPLGAGLTPAVVCGIMESVGFKRPLVQEMIHGMTKTIVAIK